MHRGWLIEDIQLLIFEHLHNQDLARLACTCTFLSEPAITQLWKTLTSLQPLISALPKYAKSRELGAGDLARLDYYSTKVQNVHLEGTLDEPITIPKAVQNLSKGRKIQDRVPWRVLWAEIASLRTQKNFMPNLRRLWINNVHEEVLIPFIGISGAHLREFYVKYMQYRQSESVVERILEQVGDTPRLEYLFVRDGEPGVIPKRIIQQSPLKRLRISTRMLNRGGFEESNYRAFTIRPAILEKSSIEHLSIMLTHLWRQPQHPTKSQKYFPLLQTLWVDLLPVTFNNCGQSKCLGVLAHGWACPFQDTKTTSPVEFFTALDNPSLRELTLKFPVTTTTGAMFLEIISAAQEHCRLGNLTELALAGGGYQAHCPECDSHPDPLILPPDLIQGMKMLLPLPQLRKLRLSAAPNFLGIGLPDMDSYGSMAKSLPSLEVLWLGSSTFLTHGQFTGLRSVETVPLANLSAFCSLFPKLVEVEVGVVDLSRIGEGTHLRWISPLVVVFVVHYWIGKGEATTDRVLELLELWFPKCDMVEGRLSGVYFAS
jgi:hypothetical protein